MTGPRVIRTSSELASFDLGAVPGRPDPQRVLMCTPEYFDVVDVKNAFMEGQAGTVDRRKAREQWEALRRTFESVGHEVLTIDGVAGLEDMVFAANQVLPGVDGDGKPYVVLSRMRYPSRQREVPYYRDWFSSHGYRVLELDPEAGLFEGMGDAIWHPGKQLLWGGYGHRTSLAAYTALSRLIGVPVIALELAHPSFYHLDTAFCALSSDTVMIFPGAFTEEGRALIARGFSRVIEAGEREASERFTCNAHALDGHTVVLERGAVETVENLRAAGFETVEVDTSEFIKSGGSVFCMKMMVY